MLSDFSPFPPGSVPDFNTAVSPTISAAGTYIVQKAKQGYTALQIAPFQIHGKVYGRVPHYTDRILKTFIDRSLNTGVLLTGEKGSGKTLLSKLLSIEAANRFNIPTFIVNQRYVGDDFNLFIQKLPPSVILFDEFEKVYNNITDQEKLLTLLEGLFTTKKLIVFTVNDKYRIDMNLINRPGRVYYMIDHKGLTEQFVREYTLDNLDSERYSESVVDVAKSIKAFNFDMLKALIEEMNRYDESAYRALEILNISPEEDIVFTASISIKEVELTAENFNPKTVWGNPIVTKQDLSFWVCDVNTGMNKKLEFPPEKLHSNLGQTIIYELEGDIRLTLTKQTSSTGDAFSFLK